MTRSAASRPLNNDRLICTTPVTLMAGRDNTVYAYDGVLWSRKSANTKILQKSIDYGANWSDVYTFDYNVGIVAVTTDGTILVGQKSSDDVYADPPAELFRSTDGGTTFASCKTLASGGFAAWSFDVYQNTVFIAEYGKYNSIYVYRSTDAGATWSTVFTHPVDASATVHIHKVHIDKVTPTNIYVSAGDSSPAKGIWYSTNNGSSWAVLTRSHQPTWMETDSDYLYMGEDLEGDIHRVLKSALASGDGAIETVFEAQSDPRGNYGNLSFYSGATDDLGNIYFGGVAYGSNNTAHNNRDAVLIASNDQGDSWAVVKTYNHHPTASTGPAAITKVSPNGFLYIRTNNPATIEKLDTAEINTQLNALLDRTTATNGVNGAVAGLNLDFESAPTFTAAQTTPATRWVDGTSGGSQARKSQWGWAIPTGGLTGTAAVQFDDTVFHSGTKSMKLSTTNTSGAISVATFRNTISASTVHELFPLQPSTAYTFTAWVKTTTVITNGTFVDVREYGSTGTLIVTNSTNKLTGTNDWTQVTTTFTTNASTRLGSILLRLNVPGNISDAWFDDLSLVATVSRQTA